jgi:hypothetical protein
LKSANGLGWPVMPLSIEDIQKAIEAFKAEKLQSVSVDKLKLMLPPILQGHMKQQRFVESGQYVYRAREYTEKPAKMGDLREPPKDIAPMSRVNRDNYPVFYCCAAYNTALTEIDAKPGATIAISLWKTTTRLSVNNVGYTETFFSQLNTGRPTPNYGEIDAPASEANKMVDCFLDQEFIKYVPRDENYRYLYKPTVAIAERMFSQEIFDGLLYPSVAHKYRGDNFAFKPRCLNEYKLKIEAVEYIHIVSADESSILKKRLDFADTFQNDGTIEWKGRAAE